MKDSTSETPDTSILAFNSKYAELRSADFNDTVAKTRIDECYNEMADNIWRICYYILNGSKKKKIIKEKIQSVFQNSERMRLDLGGGIFVVVNPPNTTTYLLNYEIGEKSFFHFGYLKFEITGDPKLSIENGESSVIARLTYLQDIFRTENGINKKE